MLGYMSDEAFMLDVIEHDFDDVPGEGDQEVWSCPNQARARAIELCLNASNQLKDVTVYINGPLEELPRQRSVYSSNQDSAHHFSIF